MIDGIKILFFYNLFMVFGWEIIVLIEKFYFLEFWDLFKKLEFRFVDF